MILSLNYFIKKAIRYERYETSSVENQLNGTSNGTGFYGQMKHKNSFLAANPPDGFSTNRDTKHPMPTVKYTGSLML